MKRHDRESRGGEGVVLGALSRACQALAWVTAAVVGALIAVVVAASLAAIAVIAAAPLMLSLAVLRARRSVPAGDPNLLEARHIGGHSWVAYAGNARR